MHDFINFNALKIIKKNYLKKIRQIQVSHSHKRINLWPSTYMQDMREIPAIVTEKIEIKFRTFHTFGGGTSIIMSVANRRTDRFACLEQFFILESDRRVTT